MFHFHRRCSALPVANGRFVLVGAVPAHLAYESDAPTHVLKELLKIASISGPNLARAIARQQGYNFCVKTFASEDEAQSAVEAAGFIFDRKR